MADEQISTSRKVSRDIDEPKIIQEVDRLVQIEKRLSRTVRPDGTGRTAEEVSIQALAIYRAMSGYDFCGGLEGALESHAQALREM